MNVDVVMLLVIVPLGAVLAAIIIMVAQMSRATQSKLDVIHELVNSRLSAALDKIDLLELRLHEITGEVPTGEPAQRRKW
jgi:hypothetical protein